MLINKTKKTLSVTYNQVTINVEPDGFLDVRDFKIGDNTINLVEKHIIRKNPDKFNQEKTEDVFKTSKESLLKIKELEDQVESLKSELEESRKSSGNADNRVQKLNEDINGLKDENKSLKKEVAELKAKVKNLS